MITLGGFGRMEHYDAIRTAGFDYAELDTPELEALPEEEFQAFCQKVQDCGFPVRSGARAIPEAEPWFFTEEFSLEKYRDYLKRACPRARQLGMEKIIIGNGKARWLTEPDSIRKEGRFVDFMRMFADIAGENGLEVILEPLGPRYSNYINTLPQAVEVIEKIHRPNVFTMADLRHLYWAKEPFVDIISCVNYVHHLHIDYPAVWPQRPFPRPEDNYDYSEFLNAVSRSGYRGMLTVEADIPRDWKSAFQGAAAVVEGIR